VNGAGREKDERERPCGKKVERVDKKGGGELKQLGRCESRERKVGKGKVGGWEQERGARVTGVRTEGGR